ncbi:MAG TPA: L-seryl-tRNA(Sec) selenium transferase [Acidimicrobiia bacterium]|jgi:L-seryl-tRNA(Ser) seleniumtransferase
MPSVDRLARDLAGAGNPLPHALLVDVAREAIRVRDPASARAGADRARRTLLHRVVNATGVLLHTNLGRAPGSEDRVDDMGYVNLEIDLETGRRGRRGASVATLLRLLTGAEDALVVNNGAAAILLVLTALAAGSTVAVSRGQLVEIGGGVRIPDVLETSGARLAEVGTTNITRAADFARALHETADGVAALLVVHQANFEMRGFVRQPALSELVSLGRPVIVDLGSGLLDATTPWLEGPTPGWLAHEPAVRQTLAGGAAVVTFSGDKLLGGPQAGIIAGSHDLVDACRTHALARALRAGRVALRQLQDLLLAYADRNATAIPFWRMATVPCAELRARAEAVSAATGARVVECRSVPGGGSAPDAEIDSVGVCLPGDVSAALRAQDPPVIARVTDGTTVCDLRTVDPEDDAHLAAALVAAASKPAP